MRQRLEIEIDMDRVINNLPCPEALTADNVAESTKEAFETGKIGQPDIAPNIYARLASEYKPNVEPCLSPGELSIRHAIMMNLANHCTALYLRDINGFGTVIRPKPEKPVSPYFVKHPGM